MPEVLIFEDDWHVGELLVDLLRSKGIEAGHYLNGAQLLQVVEKAKPRLIIMDLMMPGLDGLSACKAVKTNPGTQHIKLMVLTAKRSSEDRELALSYGAERFLNKPIDTESFLSTVVDMLKTPTVPTAGHEAAPPIPPVIATFLKGAGVVKAPGLWIWLDAGKGLREWLEGEKQAPEDLWVLLSRYEDDTTADISAAGPLLTRNVRVKVAGPDTPEGHLQNLPHKICADLPMGVRTAPLLFPQREGEFQLAPGLEASTQLTHHPGLALAYRMKINGHGIVYCPANEMESDEWTDHEHNKFRSFFSGAELMIHGWKRSWEPILDIAAQSEVRQLVLMPLEGAQIADGMQSKLRERASRTPNFECFIAHPGSTLIL